jgi:hypothetical protein
MEVIERTQVFAVGVDGMPVPCPNTSIRQRNDDRRKSSILYKSCTDWQMTGIVALFVTASNLLLVIVKSQEKWWVRGAIPAISVIPTLFF